MTQQPNLLLCILYKSMCTLDGKTTLHPHLFWLGSGSGVGCAYKSTPKTLPNCFFGGGGDYSFNKTKKTPKRDHYMDATSLHAHFPNIPPTKPNTCDAMNLVGRNHIASNVTVLYQFTVTPPHLSIVVEVDMSMSMTMMNCFWGGTTALTKQRKPQNATTIWMPHLYMRTSLIFLPPNPIPVMRWIW